MFSRTLKDLREDSDTTQEQLAKILHITRSTLSMYEIGRREPPFDILIKIADHFNVSTDYLIGRTNKKVPYNKIKKFIDHLPELKWYFLLYSYF